MAVGHRATSLHARAIASPQGQRPPEANLPPSLTSAGSSLQLGRKGSGSPAPPLSSAGSGLQLGRKSSGSPAPWELPRPVGEAKRGSSGNTSPAPTGLVVPAQRGLGRGLQPADLASFPVFGHPGQGSTDRGATGARSSSVARGSQAKADQSNAGMEKGAAPSAGAGVPQANAAVASSSSSAPAEREPTETQASAPSKEVERNTAKCQAVASLQRLFFEEVKRSGDPNAAAAAALLRLAEESRPVGEAEASGHAQRQVPPPV